MRREEIKVEIKSGLCNFMFRATSTEIDMIIKIIFVFFFSFARYTDRWRLEENDKYTYIHIHFSRGAANNLLQLERNLSSFLKSERLKLPSKCFFRSSKTLPIHKL